MDNWYYLMNGDEIVMLLRQVQDLDEMSYVEAERRSSYVPYGFTTPDAWIESRQIAKHRKQMLYRLHPLRLSDRFVLDQGRGQ